MRHKKHGRVLGRAPSHRKALYRNLATALVLTERELDDLDPNPPKVKGRIITTLEKAKEIRPLVEKCVTIAKKCREAEQSSAQFATPADRHSEAWKQWRESEQHAQWVAAQAPAVTARRRLYQILQSKQAVRILCDTLAERFEDRPGGYTRIVRLAKPRLGDAGTRAILEFVGKNDRAPKKSTKPAFDAEQPSDEGSKAQEVVSNSEGTEPAAS
jgi:large subunit ribosomal protein L17